MHLMHAAFYCDTKTLTLNIFLKTNETRNLYNRGMSLKMVKPINSEKGMKERGAFINYFLTS